MCIYISSYVAANYVSSMELSMQRSCQHLICVRFGGGVGEQTSLRYSSEGVDVLMTLHGLRSAAFITGACQVNQLHLARSPGSILINGRCQIITIEIRELPGRVQTQRVSSDHCYFRPHGYVRQRDCTCSARDAFRPRFDRKCAPQLLKPNVSS